MSGSIWNSESPRDRLIAHVLSVGLDRSDPEIERVLAADPTLREDCREVQAMEAFLKAQSEDQRLDLAASKGEAVAVDTDTILGWIDGARPERGTRGGAEGVESGEDSSGRRAPTRLSSVARWAAFVGVAAVALWVGLLRSNPSRDGTSGPGSSRDERLGERIEHLTPIGSAADLTTFRWRAARRPNEHYVVVLYDSVGDELARSPKLTDSQWTFPELDPQTTEILWHVLLVDAAGNAHAGALQQAAR